MTDAKRHRQTHRLAADILRAQRDGITPRDLAAAIRSEAGSPEAARATGEALRDVCGELAGLLAVDGANVYMSREEIAAEAPPRMARTRGGNRGRGHAIAYDGGGAMISPAQASLSFAPRAAPTEPLPAVDPSLPPELPWLAGERTWWAAGVRRKAITSEVARSQEYERTSSALTAAWDADKAQRAIHAAKVTAAKQAGGEVYRLAKLEASRSERASDKVIEAARVAHAVSTKPIDDSARVCNDAHDAWRKTGSDYYAAHIEAYRVAWKAGADEATAARKAAHAAGSLAVGATHKDPASYRFAADAYDKAARLTRDEPTYHPPFALMLEAGDYLREVREHKAAGEHLEEVAKGLREDADRHEAEAAKKASADKRKAARVRAKEVQ